MAVVVVDESEVGEHRLLVDARPSDPHVARLHVAMGEPGGVDDDDRRTQIVDEPTDRIGIERPPVGESVVQSPAVEELHHEVRAALELADLVDAHDPIVGESAQVPGAGDEPCSDPGITGLVGGEQLDGHIGTAGRIVGAIHHCGRPGPEHPDDVVAPDPVGERRRGRCVDVLDEATLSGRLA